MLVRLRVASISPPLLCSHIRSLTNVQRMGMHHGHVCSELHVLCGQLSLCEAAVTTPSAASARFTHTCACAPT